MMGKPLEDKVVLLVGASHGIGRAYALGLARAGAKIAGVARSLTTKSDGPDAPSAASPRSGSAGPDQRSVAHTANLVRAEGGTMIALKGDVAQRHDIPRVVEEAEANLGPIDVLIINSGWAEFSSDLNVPDAHWDKAFDINIRGPYAFVQAVAPGMIARRRGSIIFMSTRASLAIPADDPAHGGLLAYGVSRAGMNRMATHLAEELRPHDIAVNVMSPGIVTQLTGGAEPTVEMFAPQMVHLAQQTATTMTGQWVHTTEFGTVWP